ncbi:MAG: putative nucleic acid-binding protein [Kiritimatiellia bacterium]|jgi:predicted nucleic acid-binding protein
MICLDTNYLILGLVPGSPEATRLLAWLDAGEQFVVPSVVWYEFLCGPVNELQVRAMRSMVAIVVPFDQGLAEETAQLYHATGRRRQLRVDCMIAATAISKAVALATNNRADFQAFVRHGLDLIDP